jgi:hypothetical protein
LIATCLTALFTVIIAIANWLSADASRAVITQTANDREEDKKTSWQAAKVYEIVEDGGKDTANYKGMSLDEIMTKYKSASVDAEEKVKLGAEEFTHFRLRKILTGLQETQLVFRTWDNKYITQRTSVNTREDAQRVEATQKVMREILRTVTDNPGIKAEELEKRVVARAKEILPFLKEEDYLFTLAQLASQGLLSIDTERKVWTPLHAQVKK